MALKPFYFSMMIIFLCTAMSMYLYQNIQYHTRKEMIEEIKETGQKTKRKLARDIQFQTRQTMKKVQKTMIETEQKTKRRSSTIVSKGVQMTLLLAYARTGSTLTGEILHLKPKDFYLFEPLHRLMRTIHNQTEVTFLNGTTRGFSNVDEINDLISKTLYNWFTCNFKALDMASLTDFFMQTFTPEHDRYLTCLGPRNKTNPINITTVKKCVGILQDSCRSMTSVTIKTIRTPMKTVEYLLQSLRNLKVIYLVRDPRGMFLSRARVGLLHWKEIEEKSEMACKQIEHDLEEFARLYNKYPGRLKRLAYENLCRNPVYVAGKMYQFLRRPYMEIVKYQIRNMTTGPILKCSFCTNRGDALGNAYRWKKDMKEEKLKVIDKYCSNVYQNLSYKYLSYQQLKKVKETYQAKIDSMQI